MYTKDDFKPRQRRVPRVVRYYDLSGVLHNTGSGARRGGASRRLFPKDADWFERTELAFDRFAGVVLVISALYLLAHFVTALIRGTL